MSNTPMREETCSHPLNNPRIKRRPNVGGMSLPKHQPRATRRKGSRPGRLQKGEERRRFASGIASTLAARKIAQEDGLRREQATRLARMAWRYSNGNSRGKSEEMAETASLRHDPSERQTAGFAGSSSLQAVASLFSLMKRWTPFLLQSLVSIALLVWIFWKEDFRTQNLAGIDLRTSRLVDGGVPGGRRG